MSVHSEFDVGSLVWVKGEIDQALSRAGDCLTQYREAQSDTSQLKFCRTHLHQVTGALQMVGLDGAARFAEEVELAVASLEKGESEPTQAHLAAVSEAMAATSRYLEALINGAPDMPLRLFPEYEKLKEVRGVSKYSASELFFPSVDAFQLPANSSPAADGDLPQIVRAQRSRFELGLLKWLRGTDDGLTIMAQTLKAIEAAVRSPRQRTFWWTAGGLVEAISKRAIAVDYTAKQLFARINIQMRRLAEGSQTVADRLQRDILYYIARAEGDAESVQAIKQSFALDELLPAAVTVESGDTATRQKAAREMRELLGQAKDTWVRVTGGHPDRLPALQDNLVSLREKSAPFADVQGLNQFLHALSEGIGGLSHQAISDNQALDVATAFLLLDSICERPNTLPPELPSQLDAMSRRLQALNNPALAAEPLPELPHLDQLAQDAQAKMLQAQLMHEIQVNLQQIEQVLDGFFRDHAKRNELAGLAPYFRQIAGALSISGLDDAVEIVKWSQESTARYEDEAYPVDGNELEILAEALSTLGFYIDAVSNDRSNRDAIIAPVLRRLRGETETTTQPVTAEASVETEVNQQKQQAQELLETLRDNPEDAAAQQQLKDTLQSLQQNADLIADNALGQQSSAALSALKEAEGKPIEAFVAAVAEIVGEKPIEPAAKPAPVSDEAVDQELLEVYLEEAVEVLSNIGSNANTIKTNPRDKEALTVIRRSFHTLKGSGRMVGLNHLGEVAWSVEQVMNKWLQDDLAATSALLQLIDMAQSQFAKWIGELKDHGSASVEASSIHALAEALKRGEEASEAPTMPPESAAAAELAVADHTEDITPEAAIPELQLVSELVPPVLEPEQEALPTLELLAEEAPLAEAPAVEESVGVASIEAAVESDDLQIGDVTISPVLFDIFINEASRYLATLHEQQALLVQHPHLPVDERFLHAAHTLCGISRTAGFVDMGELGYRLEMCLQAQMKSPERLTEDDQATFSEAIAQLDMMFISLTAKLAPAPAPELVAKLEEIAEHLRKHDVAEPAQPPLVVAPPVDELDIDLDLDPDLLPDELPVLELSAEPVVAPPAFDLPTLVIEEAPSAEGEFLLTAPSEEVAPVVEIPQLEEISLSFDDEPAFPEVDTGGIVLEVEPFATTEPEEFQAAAALPDTEALDSDIELIEEPILLEAPVSEAVSHDEAPTMPVVEGLETAEDTLLMPHHTGELSSDEVDLIVDLPEEPASVSLPEPALAESIESVVDIGLTDEIMPFVEQAPEPEAAYQPSQPVEVAQGEATAETAISVQDDIDEQLLPVFLEEVNDLQPQISKVLRDWRADPAAYEQSKSLQRLLHTLKGSARMSGAMRLGEATHNLETLVIGLQDAAPTPEQFDDLEADFDVVNELIDVLQGKPEVETPESVVAQSVAAAGNLAMPAAPMGLVDADAAKSSLRVRADLVDRLVNQAGEVAIARSRMEAEMLALKGSLLDLTDNVTRLRSQLREIEIQAESQMQSRMTHLHTADDQFDPLEFDRFTRLQELTRFMAESVNDVATIQHNLLKNLDETEAALLAQGRMTKDLQQELMRIRMVPFSSMAERLYRIVRQTGKEVGKKVNLEIRGGRVEIDRSMLEKMTSPFEHMLRNAIDHGLESRENRLNAGKPEVGEISLDLKQEGNELVLTLADDGAGLNLARIREKAISKGLLNTDEPITDEQVMYQIFEPGFSTADSVSQLSGRGIGMDVVKNEISDLGGRIQLDSESGKGTRFTIHLPLTLAVTQTVLVTAAGKKYAIPSVMVEQVQELKLLDLEKLYEQKKIVWMGNDYPFTYLPRLLGNPEHQPESKRYSTVVLLRSGNQRIALHVDDLVKNQEVVVKNIGPQLARVPGIAGATVLGNGDIVLILNPLLLVNRVDSVNAEAAASAKAPVQAQPDALSMVPVIMVVDDSLTVRKISGRLLTREGYQVVTAKDGVDALQQIQDVVPDVMLVDIEMPRMDGFELTRHIRTDEKTRHIPIVMITSRTAEKHRNYALELGVNVYLGKPYQEEELLGHIERFVAHKKARQQT